MSYSVKVLKATRNPHDAVLNPLEDGMTAAVYAGLRAWQRELFRGINAANINEIYTRLNNPKLRQVLRDAIVDWLQRAADAGVMQARDEVERDVFGVKADFDINWELANNDAAEWAIRYGEQLTGELAKTTTPRIQRLISDWVSNGESLSTLINRVQDGYLYSEDRARTIAVTEVTRAFAQGNLEAWRASGVMALKRWNTGVDELVCPICRPLHRMTVPINDQFPGGYDGPPAHPRCRCFLSATVDDAVEEEMSRQVEIEWLNREVADPYEGIRPPEGRAPRGQGQEYNDRRWIISRIETQKRYRARLQNTIYNYRGQVGRTREITHAKQRIRELDKAIEAAMNIAVTDADWAFKREMVEGIISYVSEVTRVR